MYDREHEKVGFWKTNCSELWERLHISETPPPMPPNTEKTNSGEAPEPSVAPSTSRHDLLPGNISCWPQVFFLTIY